MTARLAKQSNLSALGRALVDDGVISASDYLEAQRASSTRKVPIIEYLVTQETADARQVADSVSKAFGVPVVDIDAIEIEPEAVELVPHELLRKHGVLPISVRDRTLRIAMPDPTQLIALDDIKFTTGRNTEAVVVEFDKLHDKLEKLLANRESHDDGMMGDFYSEDPSAFTEEEEASTEEDLADSPPVVRLVNKIFLDAIRQGTEQIHFEPHEKNYRVRFRKHGILETILSPPVSLAGQVASRIRKMARIPTDAGGEPQEGRIRMKLSKSRQIDFAVATWPQDGGERITVELIDPASASGKIDDLPTTEPQKALLREALDSAQGLVLLLGAPRAKSGPVLRTLLSHIDAERRNVISIVSGVGVTMDGVSQVSIGGKSSAETSHWLSAVSNQNPDVVMIEEIADHATASTAIDLAADDCLVLSSVRAVNVDEAIDRLATLGVSNLDAMSSISVVLIHRRLRKLCDACKLPATSDSETGQLAGALGVELAPETELFEPKGCDECRSGYRGEIDVVAVRQLHGGRERGSPGRQDRGQSGVAELIAAAESFVLDGTTSVGELARLVARHEGSPGLAVAGYDAARSKQSSGKELMREILESPLSSRADSSQLSPHVQFGARLGAALTAWQTNSKLEDSWGVKDARNKLSQILRDVLDGDAQFIQSRKDEPIALLSMSRLAELVHLDRAATTLADDFAPSDDLPQIEGSLQIREGRAARPRLSL